MNTRPTQRIHRGDRVGHLLPGWAPRRCLDTSPAEREFGFKAQTKLRDGLARTIHWYENEMARQAAGKHQA